MDKPTQTENKDGSRQIIRFGSKKGAIPMGSEEKECDEFIEQLIENWDNEDWPPRMTAEEYMESRGSR